MHTRKFVSTWPKMCNMPHSRSSRVKLGWVALTSVNDTVLQVYIRIYVYIAEDSIRAYILSNPWLDTGFAMPRRFV